VAVLALSGSGLVEDHRLAGDLVRQFVTVQAGHIDVSTIERIRRLFVVIKLRRFPTCGIMTTRAISGILARDKLIGVYVLMAPRAELRCRFVIDVLQS